LHEEANSFGAFFDMDIVIFNCVPHDNSVRSGSCEFLSEIEKILRYSRFLQILFSFLIRILPSIGKSVAIKFRK